MANFETVWERHKKLPAREPREFFNADFKPVWKKTKGFEGGYQAMPNDGANWCPAKGKPGSQLIGTNHGISAIGMANYIKRCPTVIEIKNLSEQKAFEIAKKQYWDQVQGDKINSQALAHLIFDITYGGSSGPLHTRQAINELAGKDTVKEFKSFKISDSEIAWINKLPEKKLFQEIYKKRIDFYKGSTYGPGLTNRMNKLQIMYLPNLVDTAKFAQKNMVALIAVTGALAVGLYFLLRKK